MDVKTHDDPALADATAVEIEGVATTTGGLVHQAIDRGSRLIAAEIELAKQEVGESVKAGVMAAIAGTIAVFGAIAFLVMLIVTVVTAVQPHWAAALGFTLIFLVITAAGAWIAVSHIKRISPLRQTVETIKEDVQWAKQQLTHDAK